MATPVRTPRKIYTTSFFVPDKELCVACSTWTKLGERVMIFSKLGLIKGGLETFNKYFTTISLANVQANWNSYLCRTCSTRIVRWLRLKVEIDNIDKSFQDKCQHFLPHVQQKRGFLSPRSPTNMPNTLGPRSNSVKKASKKLCFGQTLNGDSGFVEDSISILRNTPSYADSGVCALDESTLSQPLCSTPTNTHPFRLELSLIAPNDSCQPLSDITACVTQPSNCDSGTLQTPLDMTDAMHTSSDQRNRRETICYRTTALKKKQSRIVHCLSNGSIWKALKLINENHPEAVQKLFNTIILKEAKKFHKLENSEALRANSPSDLLSFNMERVREEIKLHAPTLWGAVCTAAKKKKGTLQLQRVTVASLILLNSRSNQLNAMQYAAGILAYQHCLQKEGIEFLSHVGLSVSHSSLMDKLKAAQTINDNKMLEWKTAVVKQNQVPQTERRDHDYCTPAIATVQSNDPCEDSPPLHPAYSLVIDNFDVEIRARNMTMNNRDKSIHYVQVMAVLDRVNVEALPLENPETRSLAEFENSHFMPSADDVYSMREDFVHLPLGIFNKSENITHELTEVMEVLHRLVPGARDDNEVDQVVVRDSSYALMRPIPLGGDQLTVERERGVHQSLVECDTPEERLEGLFAMIEDFHEKMNYLELIVQKFYKKESVLEGGTLFQLKARINRKNMTGQVRQNYHDVSGFIDLVTECHVMAAAMAYLQMETVESRPDIFPEDIHTQSPTVKAAFLKKLVRQIVDRYIYRQLGEDVDRLQACIDTDNPGQQDHVFNHASTLMTHGLIRKVTIMTTAAGDGDRAVRNWKYALLAYNTTNKVKYRLEAFCLLASVTCLLPPRLSEQLKWSRYVNVSGGPFKNVDADEAMEMLNNDARKRVKNLGPNHSPELINQIGKTIKFTSEIAKQVGWQAGVAPTSRSRTTPSLARDRAEVLDELTTISRVFMYTPGRQHLTFQHQPSSIYGGIDAAKLHRWMVRKKKEYSHGRRAF